RVIGSQAISTKPVSSAVVMALPYFPSGPGHRPRAWSPGLLEAREELVALLAPLGLLIGGLRGEAAESADHGAVHRAGGRGDLRSRRVAHERPEIVKGNRDRRGRARAAPAAAAAHP